MKIVDLYPPDEPDKRPFCEAKLSRWTAERNERWYRGNPKNHLVQARIANGIPADRCGHAARYSIDYKLFCGKHAGIVLLKKLAVKVK